MSTYFLTHPRLDKTAVVHAPSTEKARTVFLDWLERNGSINRGDRQSWRKDMLAGRIEDGTAEGDAELWYGYEQTPQPDYVPGTPVPGRIEETMEEHLRLDSQMQGVPEEETEVVPSEPTKMSPIAKAAIGSVRGF